MGSESTTYMNKVYQRANAFSFSRNLHARVRLGKCDRVHEAVRVQVLCVSSNLGVQGKVMSSMQTWSEPGARLGAG